MSTRSQKIRLGIFMLLAVMLLLGSIVTLAGLKLWNPKDRYYVNFHESVSGLEVGSTVKMKGVRVGQVEKIAISENVESVRVTLSLDPDTPIPEDTLAVMNSIGITGLQFIELTGGTGKAKRLKPNTPKSTIKVGQSTLANLTGKAEIIAQKLEAVLNNLIPLTGQDNRIRISRLLDSSNQLVVSWEEMASGNKDRIKRILSNVDRTTQMMEKASASFSRLAEENTGTLRDTLHAAASAARSIQKAVLNLNPQATLTSINGAANSVRKRVEDPSISHAINSLSSAANKLSTLTADLGRIVRVRDRQIGTVMENLDRASSNLKEFARAIKERPSLLLRGETHKERSVP